VTEPQLTIAQAYAIAADVRHRLLQRLSYLSLVVIHVDPEDQSGEVHYGIREHVHDGLPLHSHT
jgi:divalent metal cation (Fe/Co/Zn/Cd) transporter